VLQIVLTKRTITLPMGDWRVDAALRRLAWVVVVVARRSCWGGSEFCWWITCKI